MSPKNEDEAVQMGKVPYREAVGSLLYLTTTTRPDIAFAVNQVSKYCQHPGLEHWRAVKRIFAYLAGTRNLGISFKQEDVKLVIGYTDSDFAGDLDERKSTSGYIFLYNGGPVSWSCRRQECIAVSTTEAEFVAGSESAKEAIWILKFLTEIGETNTGPIPLYSDNQSAIKLIKNSEVHQRSKHIDVKYFHIREKQQKGLIDIRYVGTKDQLADIFTKALATPRFNFLRELIGVTDVGS